MYLPVDTGGVVVGMIVEVEVSVMLLNSLIFVNGQIVKFQSKIKISFRAYILGTQILLTN